MARSSLSRHLASATLIAGVLLGMFAAPAPASTARLVELPHPESCKAEYCGPSPPDTALVYLGGGEANRVTLRGDAQRVRIGDPAARIDPGPGCSRVDDHNVRCSSVLVYVATRGGSDRVRSELGPAFRLTVDGGAGNDVLVGGPGPDALLGGPGADRLRGRGGDDRLFDASSQDPLRAGDLSPGSGGSDVFFGKPLSTGRGRDSFAGGPGRDTLSYQGRRANVRIDLASTRPIAGARGERDSIRDIENAIGGAGADRIAGNRKANRLVGEGGDDRIVGRSGDDIIEGGGGRIPIVGGLEGGGGRNVIVAGPGDDTIDPHGPNRFRPKPNRISCGSGTDSVGPVFPPDFLAPDCEKPGFALLDSFLARGGSWPRRPGR